MGVGPVSSASVNLAMVDEESSVGLFSNDSNTLTEAQETYQVAKKDDTASEFKCIAWNDWVISKLGRPLGYVATASSFPIFLFLAAYDGLTHLGNGISLVFRNISKPEKPVQKFMPVVGNENKVPDSKEALADISIAKDRADCEHKAEKEKQVDQDQAQRLRGELQQQASRVQKLTAELERLNNEHHKEQTDFRLKACESEELLAKEKQEYNNSVVYFSARISEKNKEIKANKLKLSRYKEQLEQASMNAATQEKKRQKLVDNYQSLLKQHDDTKVKLDLLMKQHRTERSGFTDEKARLELRIKQLNNQCQELTEEVEVGSELLAELEELLSSANGENKELQKALRGAKHYFLDQQQKLTQEQQKRQALSRTRKTLEGRLLDERSTNRSLRDEIKSTRAKSVKLSKRIDGLKEENEQLIEEMKNQYHDKCRALEQSEQKMMAMAEKTKQFQSLFQKYISEQQASKKPCSKQHDENTRFELDELHCELDCLTSENELLKEELTQLNIKNGALQEVSDINEESIKEIGLRGAGSFQESTATKNDIDSKDHSRNLL